MIFLPRACYQGDKSDLIALEFVKKIDSQYPFEKNRRIAMSSQYVITYPYAVAIRNVI